MAIYSEGISSNLMYLYLNKVEEKGIGLIPVMSLNFTYWILSFLNKEKHLH